MKRGEKVEDKIKELVKLVGQLNKLMLKVIELLGYTTLAISIHVPHKGDDESVQI